MTMTIPTDKPLVAFAPPITGRLVGTTPMDMLDRAVQSGASIDVLEKLMALQERWEANQAKRAFENAMADAKAEFEFVKKSRSVDYGKGKPAFAYEDLADIGRAVDEPLAKHGLTYRFRTSSPPGEKVSVTCIISHRDGHREENTLSDNPDTSGSKNSVQAIGSIVTYLQRYTLKSALGLAAVKDDDDAQSYVRVEKPEGVISAEQAQNLMALIENAGLDISKALQTWNIKRIEDLPANKWLDVLSDINEYKKWQAKKAEQSNAAANS